MKEPLADMLEKDALTIANGKNENSSGKKSSSAYEWYSRALIDGRHCFRKGRAKFFHEYLEDAEESLNPTSPGAFWLVYKIGFRVGYDDAKIKAEGARPIRKRYAKKGKRACKHG